MAHGKSRARLLCVRGLVNEAKCNIRECHVVVPSNCREAQVGQEPAAMDRIDYEAWMASRCDGSPPIEARAFPETRLSRRG